MQLCSLSFPQKERTSLFSLSFVLGHLFKREKQKSCFVYNVNAHTDSTNEASLFALITSSVDKSVAIYDAVSQEFSLSVAVDSKQQDGDAKHSCLSLFTEPGNPA